MEDHEARNVNDLIARLDANRLLLCTMHVDRKLDGVNTVRTVSRLHRMCPGTKGRWVFDSANPAQESQEAFEFYQEIVLFLEKTDPKPLGFDPILDGESHKIMDSVRPVVVWRGSR